MHKNINMHIKSQDFFFQTIESVQTRKIPIVSAGVLRIVLDYRVKGKCLKEPVHKQSILVSFKTAFGPDLIPKRFSFLFLMCLKQMSS